jgi:hypothetical protein
MACAVDVLELLATWLGAGRLAAGSSARDIDACLEHVAAVCAIRSTRRWEVIISVRMLASVHAGRTAWAMSMYRLTLSVQIDRVQNEHANDRDRFLDLERMLFARIHALEAELRQTQEIALELQNQVAAARRLLGLRR